MARKSKKTSLAQKGGRYGGGGHARTGEESRLNTLGSTHCVGRCHAPVCLRGRYGQWSDYRPHLKVNRERAEEVKEAIVDQAHKLGIEKADRSDSPGFFGRRTN